MYTSHALHRTARTLSRSVAPFAAALVLALNSPNGSALAAAPDAAASGRGWGTSLACIGCVAGVAVIGATGGVAAIITASFTPGSTVLVAGCIYACYDAIGG